MGIEIINGRYKSPMIIAAVIILGMLAYSLLTAEDTRDTSDRISDAFHELEDRTPGQKLGDAIGDVGDTLSDKIKENTAPSTTP